jgi:hypothetical protein
MESACLLVATQATSAAQNTLCARTTITSVSVTHVWRVGMKDTNPVMVAIATKA